MSDGIRSGVNCTRLKVRFMLSASVRIMSVFASPGTPTSSAWPWPSSAMRRSSSTSCWPTITLPHSVEDAVAGVAKLLRGHRLIRRQTSRFVHEQSSMSPSLTSTTPLDRRWQRPRDRPRSSGDGRPRRRNVEPNEPLAGLRVEKHDRHASRDPRIIRAHEESGESPQCRFVLERPCCSRPSTSATGSRGIADSG